MSRRGGAMPREPQSITLNALTASSIPSSAEIARAESTSTTRKNKPSDQLTACIKWASRPWKVSDIVNVL
jgi:hypothetical protein